MAFKLDHGSPQHRVYQVAGWVLLAVIAFGLPFWTDKTNTVRFTEALTFAVAIMGLNLVTGLTGQVSLGHAAFMGSGAVITAWLVVDKGWGFFPTVPVSALFCFAVGILVGIPALRLKGLYLALATFGLSVIFPRLAEKYEFSGGKNGKRLGRNRLVPPDWTGFDTTADQHKWVYFVVLFMTAILFLIARNILRSRTGRALIALRDNPIGAAVSGVDLARHKVLAFGLSAAYAGIAGSMFMFTNTVARGSRFSVPLSIELLTGLVIGGMATVGGPLLGGLLVVWLPKIIDDNTSTTDPRNKAWATIIYGIALIAIMFAYPGGLANLVRSIRQRIVSIVPHRPGRHRLEAPPRETATNR